MARFIFGGETTHVGVQEDATNANAFKRLAAGTALPWRTTPGGAVVTDFLLWDGAAFTIAASAIVADANGYAPVFQAPDGVSVLYDPNGYALLARDSVSGAGITDGDKGDVVVSSSGTVWTVTAVQGGSGGLDPANPAVYIVNDGTAAPGAPTTPAAPLTSDVTATTMTVGWVAVPGATSYTLQRLAGSWTTVYSGSGTSFADSGLTAAFTYGYRVSATGSGGTSPYSPVQNVTTAAAIVAPGVPTSVAATPGNTTLNVTWAPPSDSGGSPITSYEVERTPTGVTTTYGATLRAAQLTGLTNDTLYTIRVRAVNSAGAGAWVTVTATPVAAAAAVPTVPLSVTAVPAGTSAIDVDWLPPTSDGGSAITGYDVFRDQPDWTGTQSSVARAITLTNFTAGLTYSVKVRAINAIGPGPWVTVAVAMPGGGGAATGLKAAILALSGLTHYYVLDNVTQAVDQKGTLNGVVNGTVTFTATGAVFNGSAGNYIQIPDHNDFSLVTTDQLSIVVVHSVSDWASTSNTASGYVHWMGKGASSSTQEWTWRYYPSGDATRPKRTSAYHYSPADTLGNSHQGAGSYEQDNDAINVERMYVANFDRTTTSGVTGAGSPYPGAVWLYKNGVLRDSDGFYNSGTYNIAPGNTNSPVRIGTRDMASWQKGKISHVAFFNRKLTAAEISSLYAAR